MEKPLAVLRAELAELGIARQKSGHEPEDHAAAASGLEQETQ
jgi:TorA maturation chaperone TorD